MFRLQVFERNSILRFSMEYPPLHVIEKLCFVYYTCLWWKNKELIVQNHRFFLRFIIFFLIFFRKILRGSIYSCIKRKEALLVYEKSLTKIVQNWFWILNLWFNMVYKILMFVCLKRLNYKWNYIERRKYVLILKLFCVKWRKKWTG